mmetsp:Transcript_24793/g.37047  ORF Transcript_24793/g.37047 Transcript_24793/m.37047 type:complete len:280 (+) Transcript_24793:442-1281(+)
MDLSITGGCGTTNGACGTYNGGIDGILPTPPAAALAANAAFSFAFTFLSAAAIAAAASAAVIFLFILIFFLTGGCGCESSKFIVLYMDDTSNTTPVGPGPPLPPKAASTAASAAAAAAFIAASFILCLRLSSIVFKLVLPLALLSLKPPPGLSPPTKSAPPGKLALPGPTLTLLLATLFDDGVKPGKCKSFGSNNVTSGTARHLPRNVAFFARANASSSFFFLFLVGVPDAAAVAAVVPEDDAAVPVAVEAALAEGGCEKPSSSSPSSFSLSMEEDAVT